MQYSGSTYISVIHVSSSPLAPEYIWSMYRMFSGANVIVGMLLLQSSGIQLAKLLMTNGGLIYPVLFGIFDSSISIFHQSARHIMVTNRPLYSSTIGFLALDCNVLWELIWLQLPDSPWRRDVADVVLDQDPHHYPLPMYLFVILDTKSATGLLRTAAVSLISPIHSCIFAPLFLSSWFSRRILPDLTQQLIV